VLTNSTSGLIWVVINYEGLTEIDQNGLLADHQDIWRPNIAMYDKPVVHSSNDMQNFSAEMKPLIAGRYPLELVFC
jgi:hypothetical protein